MTFQAAPGVSATTTCEMAVSATHVVFRDLDLAGLRLGGSARYVTLRNVDVTCEDRAPFRLYGSKCSAGLFIAGPASDFAMYGGSVGPTWDSDVDGSPGNSQIGIPYGGGPAESKNLLFDGVRFHDNRIAPGAHSECLMVGGGNGLIFRNMRFDNCNIFGIYFTWWNFVSPSYPVATNILIENSWFEEPLAGSGYYAVRFGDYMGAFRDITVRNNSWTGLLSIGDSPKTNVNFIGNVGPLSQGECKSGINYRYNVWNGARCGSTDKNAPSGFVNASGFDLHLAPGSAAINAGDPNNYPNTDIDGQSRPLGGTPDAGADERS